MLNKVSIIIAVDRLNGIGKNGTIPWKDPLDMKWFAYITSKEYVPGKKNAVIMGHTTWRSLPSKYKPLPNRVNVVVSRNRSLTIPDLNAGCIAHSYESAIHTCIGDPEIGKVFIIGGASIYKEALKETTATELLMSCIQGSYECDAQFSMFDMYDIGKFKHFDNLLVGDMYVHRFTREANKPDPVGPEELKRFKQ